MGLWQLFGPPSGFLIVFLKVKMIARAAADGMASAGAA
jgi:hypothetical protein